MNIQDETAKYLRAADRAPTHPRCKECRVPMWLISVARNGTSERKHFECKACDAQLVTDE